MIDFQLPEPLSEEEVAKMLKPNDETGASTPSDPPPAKPDITKNPPQYLQPLPTSDPTQPIYPLTAPKSYPVSTATPIEELPLVLDPSPDEIDTEPTPVEEGQRARVTAYPPKPDTLPEIAPVIRPKENDTTPTEIPPFAEEYQPLTDQQVHDIQDWLRTNFTNRTDFIQFFHQLSQAPTYDLTNSTRNEKFLQLFDPQERYLVNTSDGYQFRHVSPNFLEMLNQSYQRDLRTIFEPLLSPLESVSYEQLARAIKDALANR
jgi:hypothetical protein